MLIKKNTEKMFRFFCSESWNFVAANTVEEIGALFDGVISKLEKQVKRTAMSVMLLHLKRTGREAFPVTGTCSKLYL